MFFKSFLFPPFTVQYTHQHKSIGSLFLVSRISLLSWYPGYPYFPMSQFRGSQLQRGELRGGKESEIELGTVLCSCQLPYLASNSSIFSPCFLSREREESQFPLGNVIIKVSPSTSVHKVQQWVCFSSIQYLFLGLQSHLHWCKNVCFGAGALPGLVSNSPAL